MANDRLSKVFEEIGPKLKGHDSGVTAKQINARSVDMTLLERESLISNVGTVQTGKRGRPPILWALTSKGEAVLNGEAVPASAEATTVRNAMAKAADSDPLDLTDLDDEPPAERGPEFGNDIMSQYRQTGVIRGSVIA
jgi:hypothetical protein